MRNRRLSIMTVAAVLAALLLAPAALAGTARSSAGLMDWTDVPFVASEGAAGDMYGQAVALDGDTAVVGAPGRQVGDDKYQGAAYVYTGVDGLWTQQSQLTAADGKEYEFFGMAVALDGDTLAVGAPGAEDEHGAVYVYTRSGDAWAQQARLTGSETSGDGSIVGKTSNEFGGSLCLRDDVLVVGAPGKDGRGAVYVYYRSDDTWTLEETIASPDTTTSRQDFGFAVSYEGDTLAIGAPSLFEAAGAVYVYVFIQDQWQQQAKLAKPDSAGARTQDAIGGNLMQDDFGRSVSLKGDVLAVGSPQNYVAAPPGDGAVGFVTNPSAAYVYRRADGSWSQVAELTPAVAQTGDWFGSAVALAGDLTVFVGASRRDVGDVEAAGVVYAYDWTGMVYQEPSQLVADLGEGAWLGTVLAESEGSVLAGAPGAKVGENAGQGAAQLYFLPGPTAKVKGHKVAWQHKPVTLRFTGEAATGGAAVDSTQYRINGGDWKTATSVKVKRQGKTKVQYRAVDVFGTRGPARSCTVRVDTRRPTVVAKAATGKAGTIARMEYKVADPQPSSGTALVRLVVENAAGVMVTRSSTVPVTTNAWHTVRIKALRLTPGTYRVLLHAVDRAGNEQKGWTATTLTVK